MSVFDDSNHSVYLLIRAHVSVTPIHVSSAECCHDEIHLGGRYLPTAAVSLLLLFVLCARTQNNKTPLNPPLPPSESVLMCVVYRFYVRYNNEKKERKKKRVYVVSKKTKLR